MYAFVHNNTAYGPSGLIADQSGTPLPASEAGNYNQAVEADELAYIASCPARLFLYVREPDKAVIGAQWTVATWLGTHVAMAQVGSKVRSGFQGDFGCYRRSISCRIQSANGSWILYHGWYYESSGDYCRLKRAVRQIGVKP